MAIYSTRFANVTLPGAVNTLLYTVPAGNVVVIRDIEAWGGMTGSALLSINAGAPGSTGVIWAEAAFPSSTWKQWTGRAVLEAGDELFGYCGLAGMQLYVSGYLLS